MKMLLSFTHAHVPNVIIIIIIIIFFKWCPSTLQQLKIVHIWKKKFAVKS